MVNAFGREIRAIEDMPSRKVKKGRGIYLTIDYTLQKVAEEAFPDSLCGAVVALNPENGDILAMVSSPRFDPNIFTQSSKNRSRHWRRLLFDPKKPLNNRATTGLYPPGSTFKLVTAAAGLNENIIDVHETFKPCFGSFQFGSRTYKCWQPKGHGALSLINGVQKSCDVYFYQVGLKTGIDYIAQYAHMFGFGQKTGVDLPEESAGEILDERTYNEKFKDRGWIWTKGQILNSAIGQGQVVSPIQLANYPGALVKETALFKPHLFLYSPRTNGARETWKADTLGYIDLKDETRMILIQALRAVIEPGGTGGYARVDSVDIGGKTGTAQNPQGNDHALFFALGPLKKPTIAVAVVVENAGHGGSVAAPIAGKILRTYFNKPGR
ncbi:MAG: hypothetical protein A2350_16050 [Candidatus Raymondbacteria bacterium RifOxyB12_full_50_8]|nr:MAG: hypothetical protein A2350_16050 [Candidatus Raymondbacteria bacterium RifOxyB12_full_50_8]